MSAQTQPNAAQIDVNPSAALDEASAAQLELLEKDEIVEFSIKPSLWLIVFASAPLVALVGVLAAAVALATRGSGVQIAAYAIALGVLLAVLRIVVASLQWASRVYILTNRRVMRLSGILNVDIAECQLARIGQTHLHLPSVQRVLGVGSICMAPAGGNEAIVWEHVAKVGPIYEKVIRAIRRAQSGK